MAGDPRPGGRPRGAIAALVCVAVLNGCTPRVLGVYERDVERKEQESRTGPLPGSNHLAASVLSVRRTEVEVGLSTVSTCERVVQASVRRVRVTNRAWVEKERNDCLNPLLWIGCAVFILPLPFMMAGCIGGAIRARDSTDDLGWVEQVPARTPEDCASSPLADASAELVFPGGGSAVARSGAEGRARFDVHDASLDDLERRTARVRIGDRWADIELDRESAASLARALRDDRRSRVAREEAARRVGLDDLLHGR